MEQNYVLSLYVWKNALQKLQIISLDLQTHDKHCITNWVQYLKNHVFSRYQLHLKCKLGKMLSEIITQPQTGVYSAAAVAYSANSR